MTVSRPQQANQLNFWNELSQLERSALKRTGNSRVVYNGDLLFQGSSAGLTIPLRGCWIRLQTRGNTTHRTVVDMAGPGNLASPLHALDPDCPLWLGQVGETQGVAIGRGHILEIPEDVIPVLLHDLPNVRWLVMRLVNAHLHLAIQMHASSRLDVRTRLARLLLYLRCRFGERQVGNRGSIALAPPLSQPDLAAWVGASEASVARVFKQWRLAELIRTSRSSISVLNVRGLRAEADSPDMPFSRPPVAGRSSIRSSAAAVADAMRNASTSEELTLNTDMPPGLEGRWG